MSSEDTAAATPPAPRHLGAGAALSVAADVGTLVASGAVSVVLARAIGSAANGKYALLLTLVNIAVLIASLGLGAGITYQVSHGRWTIRRAAPAALAAAAVLGVVGLAASLAFYLLTQHSVMRHVSSELALIALPSIPAAVAWQFTTAILLGRDRYEGYTLLLLFNALVTLVGSVALALAFGLTGAVIGLCGATWLTALLGAAMLWRWIRTGEGDDGALDSASHLRDAFGFGLQAWLGNIVQQANYRLDLLVLGAYAAAGRIGVYSVAVTITAIAWVLPHGLQTVLFPRAAQLDAEASSGRLEAADSDAAVARATRHSVLLTVPAGVGVALLLALVPLVYGGRFGETVALGFVLLPGVLVLGVGKVLGSVVTGRGGPRYMLYSSAIGAVATIVLYFTLIPAFHEWGAAGASSFSYAFTTLVVVGYFRKATRIPLRTALVPTRADLRNYVEAAAALRLHLGGRRGPRPAA